MLVNGGKSDSFPIDQGVAQVDPLSTALYAIFENALLQLAVQIWRPSGRARVAMKEQGRFVPKQNCTKTVPLCVSESHLKCNIYTAWCCSTKQCRDVVEGVLQNKNWVHAVQRWASGGL